MFHKGTQLHTKEMSVLYFHQISNMTKLILFKVIFIRWFHGVFSILSKLSVDCDFSIPANIRLDEDVFRLRLQKTSSRRLNGDGHILINHTSSRRLGQDQYIRLVLQEILQKRLQDVFKTSSRPLQDVLPILLQNVFKTSCKYILKTSSRHFEDVFKTSSRRLSKTPSRRFQDVSSS